MSLRISSHFAPPSSPSPSPASPPAAARAFAPPPRLSRTRPRGAVKAAAKRGASVVVRSSLGFGTTIGGITEVDKDTFWPMVEAAGYRIVVLDMYTQRCGPCKIMAPKVQELSEKYLDVVFLKLDCNQENKTLAKELGIRVVPTFKILKGGKIVQEVTGAKYDDLVSAIDSTRSG